MPTITVPNLTSKELLAKAKKDAKLIYVNSNYEDWDFMKDEGGKTYEVLIWNPDKKVSTQEVRDHFKELGADGNRAALIAWVTETKPAGYHISIPSDDDLLYRDSDGDLDAPYFYYNGARRGLHLRYVDRDWSVNYVFVAFAEVKTVKIKVPVNFFSQLADCVERSKEQATNNTSGEFFPENFAGNLISKLRTLAAEEPKWSCGKCDGMDVPEHFRTCPKANAKKFEESVKLAKEEELVCHCGELMKEHCSLTHPGFEAKEMEPKKKVDEFMEWMKSNKVDFLDIRAKLIQLFGDI